MHANGVPIAVPLFCMKWQSPYSKMFHLMTREAASTMRSMSKSRGRLPSSFSSSRNYRRELRNFEAMLGINTCIHFVCICLKPRTFGGRSNSLSLPIKSFCYLWCMYQYGIWLISVVCSQSSGWGRIVEYHSLQRLVCVQDQVYVPLQWGRILICCPFLDWDRDLGMYSQLYWFWLWL